MAKKQFKAESKRLLDLMINSIYTHKEIFLREIISNASDAIDKLCYLSLTDDKVGLDRGDFKIEITADKDARTLTVSDNGIGMDKDELENNLGVIASSGSYKFRQEAEQKAMLLLEKVGLADKAGAYPCNLSGGQCQRVAIARALAMDPEILCFDEPTSALDPQLTQEVLCVIRQLAAEKRTMIVVTHEMNFARDVADRVIYMENGLVAEDGPAKEVLGSARSAAIRAFAGECGD